jgi:L-fuculose-phosphate aldolase
METLEHTASIVWKAIQLGNLNVLPDNERDRLMALRGKYNLTGRVSFCDATPMPSRLPPDGADIDEQRIRDIAAQVIAKLKKN